MQMEKENFELIISSFVVIIIFSIIVAIINRYIRRKFDYFTTSQNYEKAKNDVIRDLKEKHERALDDLKLDKSNLTRTNKSLQNELRESNGTVNNLKNEISNLTRTNEALQNQLREFHGTFNSQYSIFLKEDMRRIYAEKDAYKIKFENQHLKVLELERELARQQNASEYTKTIEGFTRLEYTRKMITDKDNSARAQISFHGNKLDRGCVSQLSIDAPDSFQSHQLEEKSLHELREEQPETPKHEKVNSPCKTRSKTAEEEKSRHE